MEWLNRMSDALDYIERHLEEEVGVEEAAQAAYASPFHFQRMFHMVTGMTVAEYVRRRRLTLAAQELAMSGAKVVDVSFKYGYDSPESFAKAFRKVHGVAPSEARDPGVRLKAFPRIAFQLSLKGAEAMDYRIVERDAFHVVGKMLHTTCRDGENLRAIPKFWGQCLSDGTDERLLAIGKGLAMGICLPMEVGSEDVAYMIGVEAAPEAATDGLTGYAVPASAWAVFASVGPLPGAIQQTFDRIFQEWFPATGYEHAVGPELEVYADGDTNAEDYRCEVWIPVVKK